MTTNLGIDVGERVVVLDRDRGRREDMDEEVLIGATILTFREGKVARWEFYSDRAEALEAAGLSTTALKCRRNRGHSTVQKKMGWWRLAP
jgi:hypothetical protein